MADDAPVMARLIRAVQAQQRAAEHIETLVVEAMAAGENQKEIARIIGRSREHLRTIKRRVESR